MQNTSCDIQESRVTTDTYAKVTLQARKRDQKRVVIRHEQRVRHGMGPTASERHSTCLKSIMEAERRRKTCAEFMSVSLEDGEVQSIAKRVIPWGCGQTVTLVDDGRSGCAIFVRCILVITGLIA